MPHNLVFDADDTLWENNVLFERAVELFLDHVAGSSLPREQVRARLDEIEKVNSHRYGYGVDVFERSLGECATEFRGLLGETDRQVLRVACAPIRAQEVELIDGVVDTLRALSQRHRLFLLTKGDHTEQTGKIEASGLAGFFTDITIVREKETPVYRDFLARRGLAAADTWMIGNSPRSDIWPALEAGLGAVLVPHPMTWSLESRDLPDGHAKFHTVSPFAQLGRHF
ncbi:putative hydrolase of the HAD superfamily [Halopolyspora algeriensis]|uniref:Putative hydrolase of the HAD superfamily n=1 Tax=Halopolyspora algeriensis TaxID=1500506 RepID=A0A368VVM0_9ACTN|nr:HAD family hydrolase [Halopolyspora algeriensis]RCW45935.1 putative hydrolase of the HAD superfamily [Halopolyspora algeriensis]TQM55348.1 putative hydrolase of the HAD superfamily [Halopolyspora algeriensis]